MDRAVIFDMDGVIIDSEPLHYEVDLLILKECGCPVEEEYLDRFVGFTNPAMWEILRDELQIDMSVGELIEKQVGRKIRLLNERPYEPIRGIPELMEAISSKKIPIGLASSSPKVLISAVIEKLGLENFISTWESGEEVQKSKPAPDIFFHVADLLGVAPENCTVIEDSRSGVAAAKAAGMTCIAFRNPHSGSQDLSRADRIVNSIGDIRI